MTTGMSADEIAAAAVNSVDPARPDPAAIERARRKMERAEAKRERRDEKLDALAGAGAIGTAEPTAGVRKLLQFGMKFDALLSPGDAEMFARRHLESLGLHIHDVYATGVRKSDARVLRPDRTQALEEYEFHADVTIPHELMQAFADAADAEAARSNVDVSAVRDTPAGS